MGERRGEKSVWQMEDLGFGDARRGETWGLVQAASQSEKLRRNGADCE